MSQRPVLQITSEEHPDPGTQVISLSGKLLGTPEAYEMLEETRERIQGGAPRVCLRMEGVTMINSSGAGVIAALYTSAHNQGGEVVLIGLDERCRKVVHMMRIDGFVRMADTLAEALGEG